MLLRPKNYPVGERVVLGDGETVCFLLEYHAPYRCSESRLVLFLELDKRIYTKLEIFSSLVLGYISPLEDSVILGYCLHGLGPVHRHTHRLPRLGDPYIIRGLPD